MGIVIPVFENNDVLKLKIRKSEWEEGDFYGKYYEVPGSSQTLPIFGNHSRLDVAIIVEAELDVMLVVQEAGDLCAWILFWWCPKEAQLISQSMATRQNFTSICFGFRHRRKK